MSQWVIDSFRLENVSPSFARLFTHATYSVPQGVMEVVRGVHGGLKWGSEGCFKLVGAGGASLFLLCEASLNNSCFDLT